MVKQTKEMADWIGIGGADNPEMDLPEMPWDGAKCQWRTGGRRCPKACTRTTSHDWHLCNKHFLMWTEGMFSGEELG